MTIKDERIKNRYTKVEEYLLLNPDIVDHFIVLFIFHLSDSGLRWHFLSRQPCAMSFQCEEEDIHCFVRYIPTAGRNDFPKEAVFV